MLEKIITASITAVATASIIAAGAGIINDLKTIEHAKPYIEYGEAVVEEYGAFSALEYVVEGVGMYD